MTTARELLALIEYHRDTESHDPKMRELVKNPLLIKKINSDVYLRVQGGEKISGWIIPGNGYPAMTDHMTFKAEMSAPLQHCECGKVLDYVFTVTFPQWFVDAAGLESDTYDLGQECVKMFSVLYPIPGHLPDDIKRQLKPLQQIKKHGAMS
jgi:hypothetical protein